MSSTINKYLIKFYTMLDIHNSKVNYNIMNIIDKKLEEIYLEKWKKKMENVNTEYNKFFYIKTYEPYKNILHKGKILRYRGYICYKFYNSLPFNYRDMTNPNMFHLYTDIFNKNDIVAQLPPRYFYSNIT